MKIQYISNFGDNTGWAKSATYNALALHLAGHDVACHQMTYNNQSIYFEDDIKQLIEKKFDNPDYILHHYLPKDYKYIGGAINVAVIELDTLNLANTVWIKNIKMMDLVFVPNIASKECLVRSGIDSDKIRIFNNTFNYDKIINTKISVNIPEMNNKFNFAFMGNISQKKNLESLLIAFHKEFDAIEPVNLYIKTSGNIKHAVDFCENVKQKMKRYKPFKREIIISEYLPEEALLAILKQCHAFVMPSHGEAWCYPAIEAMALGIPTIYTKGIGISDYDTCGYEVESFASPCYAAYDTFEDLYTSEENWLNISISDLQDKMRNLYELYQNDNQSYKDLSEKCTNSVNKFNFTNNNIVKDLFI
jgi:glycosyltransferase involved in cell wall biosynthesis